MSTETMERPAEYVPCPGSRHGATNDAWKHNCRHPAAVAAHEQWLAERDTDHSCNASRHDTNLAWMEGCRSDRAEAAHRKAVERKANADQVRRGRESSNLYYKSVRKIQLRTGGRLSRDPRQAWRGGKMLIDRNNLMHLMWGFPDDPTVGELVAAVARAETRLVPASAWSARRIDNFEIARALGIDDRQVFRLRKIRERLRSERTRRRLADVQWKAALVAEAPARKARESLAHQAAAERRLSRKQYGRTMRRLRESQERAKVIAWAIERKALLRREGV